MISLKLNQSNEIAEFKDKEMISGTWDWPKTYSQNALLTLMTGDSVAVSNFALVYQEGGYDESWIPAKYYRTWKLMGTIPIKYGDIAVEVEFKKVKAIEIKTRKKSGSGPLEIVSFFRSGDKIDAKFNKGEGIISGNFFEAIAFLGSTDKGFVHVPLDTITKIDFEKSH